MRRKTPKHPRATPDGCPCIRSQHSCQMKSALLGTSPGCHLRQPPHTLRQLVHPPPGPAASRRGRSTSSRTALQDELQALLDLNEHNIQLEEQVLEGRWTTAIATKASVAAVMLAAKAVCCSRCCAQKD